jgi:hypothetical protein
MFAAAYLERAAARRAVLSSFASHYSGEDYAGAGKA